MEESCFQYWLRIAKPGARYETAPAEKDQLAVALTRRLVTVEVGEGGAYIAIRSLHWLGESVP